MSRLTTALAVLVLLVTPILIESGEAPAEATARSASDDEPPSPDAGVRPARHVSFWAPAQVEPQASNGQPASQTSAPHGTGPQTAEADPAGTQTASVSVEDVRPAEVEDGQPGGREPASDELLQAAVVSYGGTVAIETDRVEMMAESLRSSRSELASIQQSVAELESQVAALEARAVERIVDAYINPPESSVGYMFGGADLNATIARSSLLRTLADRHLLALADIDEVRVELVALEAEAEEVVGRIETLSHEQFEATEELGEARRKQLEMEVELRERIATFVDEVDALEEEEPELVQLLAQATDELIPTKVLGRSTARTGMITPAPGEMTSDFGPRWGRMHKGIDIAGDAGTPIYAVMEGIVLRATASGGYGNNVILYHGDGFTTLYGHMRELYVTEGQLVTQGTQLGEMGSTGSATGPHLHFEIRFGGTAVDPDPFLP